MNLKDILSISGYSGLFRFIAKSRNGIIVESLADKKRMNVSASSKVVSLEDITIYTDDKDLPLSEALKAIFDKEQGQKSLDAKSSAEDLKKYFAEVVPAYDRDKVYVSDIKKLLSWYNQLQALDLLKFDEEPKEESPEEKKEENQ